MHYKPKTRTLDRQEYSSSYVYCAGNKKILRLNFFTRVRGRRQFLRLQNQPDPTCGVKTLSFQEERRCSHCSLLICLTCSGLSFLRGPKSCYRCEHRQKRLGPCQHHLLLRPCDRETYLHCEYCSNRRRHHCLAWSFGRSNLSPQN